MMNKIENQTKYYRILADYFKSKPLYLDQPTQKKPNIRKLVEQPWRLTKGEMWNLTFNHKKIKET